MDDLGVNLFYNTPLVAPLSVGRLGERSLMPFFGHMYLCQQLGVPCVRILLMTGRVDSFFQGACHMSPFGWLCHFRC